MVWVAFPVLDNDLAIRSGSQITFGLQRTWPSFSGSIVAGSQQRRLRQRSAAAIRRPRR
jgi:hypothetical protein